MKWPKHIRIMPIPWGEAAADETHRRQEAHEPESGTAQMRRRFDEVLHAVRSGESCSDPLTEVVFSVGRGGERSASGIRIRVMIPIERDDSEAYWTQTALLDELKEAIAHPTRTRGIALRNALSDAGVYIMYLDRARPKPFGEPDWHEEGRLLM